MASFCIITSSSSNRLGVPFASDTMWYLHILSCSILSCHCCCFGLTIQPSAGQLWNLLRLVPTGLFWGNLLGDASALISPRDFRTNCKWRLEWLDLYWFVVQCAHLEKWWSESQWEGWHPFSMKWKINNVPNHQPEYIIYTWETRFVALTGSSFHREYQCL